MSRHRRVVVVVAAGACALGVAAAVRASIPDAGGVIHGCYQTSPAHGLPTGTLRVIDTSKPSGNCASSEAPLNWNAKGPQGPPGPTGARGPSDLWDVAVAGPLKSTAFSTIGTLSLPPGSYLVRGEASVDDLVTATTIECQLVDSAATLDKSFSSVPAAARPGIAVDEAAVTLTSADSVEFECESGSNSSVAIGGHLNAIQTGAIH